ncbi:hypothetical protein [Desulfoscipio gibsoniae]
MLKKPVWLAIALSVLLAVPVYGAAPPDDDAVYAYNQNNLFYEEDFFRSD